MTMAKVLAADLPATLAAWQAGTIDTRKAQAITETSYVLSGEQRRCVPHRGEVVGQCHLAGGMAAVAVAVRRARRRVRMKLIRSGSRSAASAA